MRTRSLILATVAAAAFAFAAGCRAPPASDTLVATSPDGDRIAVASAGMRNLRVLRVSGGSIVRLREVFVPEGEVIYGITWSEDGRNVIVTTRGPGFAVDTRTWRVDVDTARAGIDPREGTRG
jgi:WD40 repeat protein